MNLTKNIYDKGSWGEEVFRRQVERAERITRARIMRQAQRVEDKRPRKAHP